MPTNRDLRGEKPMLKRALKSAAGIGIGVMTGSVIIPRLLFSGRYNSTYPPLSIHALQGFLFGYAGSFAVCLLVEWLKTKSVKEN